MKIFLIDFENVKSKGLTGIDKLNSDDTVVILYSENSDTISFEMHQKVMTCKADVEYFKVNVGGKNALDFQLSTLLGYIVAKDAFSHAFIISNDRGFDFLHDFWHGHFVEDTNTVVYRTRTISQAISYALGAKQIRADDQDNDEVDNDVLEVLEEAVQSTETTAVSDTETSAVIEEVQEPKPRTRRPRGYMPNLTHILQEVCTDDQIREISRLLSESETKEELHNSLAKIYKQQATDFYKLIRPRYLRLKQLYLKENPEKTDTAEPLPQAAEAKPAEETSAGKDKLTELLEQVIEKEYIGETDRVAKCIHSAHTKQQLYIRMIKEFGKEQGCTIYKGIKGSCGDLLATARECE
ncbi:MAG: hypothetical protein IJ740_19740 [Ruminococcus sp.]|nr:hypothetical protein [Ruminococcus sp.]MBR1753077.1 hypothetical protein [Ruminococcus sp.]